MASFTEAERGHQIVIEGIKDIYRNIVRPIEAATKFDIFHSNMLTDAEVRALSPPGTPGAHYHLAQSPSDPSPTLPCAVRRSPHGAIGRPLLGWEDQLHQV